MIMNIKQNFKCTKFFPTLIGHVGLLLFATTALLTTQLKHLPPFQVLSISLGVSFLCSFLYLIVTKRFYLLKQPLSSWIIGTCSMCGNIFLYFLAFKHAPADKADLIIYLWPIMVILLSSCLTKEKFSYKYLWAGIIAFSGILFLFKGQGNVLAFEKEHLPGFAYALACALCWCSYTLFSRQRQKGSPITIGFYHGIGAIVACILHFSLESAVTLNLKESVLILYYSLGVYFFAYLFWDYGVKKGNFKFLTIQSYFNPILSIALLYAFGAVEFSSNIGVACALVSAGAFLAKS